MATVEEVLAEERRHVAMVDAWPFEDSRNTASITTRQVLDGAPVLLVTHDDDDGSWQFLCGTTDDPADARVVGLGEMYKRDPSLGEVADLPKAGGPGARRRVGSGSEAPDDLIGSVRF